MSNSKEIQHAGLPKLPRVWEIDALRGILILLVVLDHFMFDVFMFKSQFVSDFWQKLGDYSVGYYNGTNFFGVLKEQFRDVFIFVFIFLSGISSSFSRCNWVRGVKMSAFALLFTAVTHLIQNIATNMGYRASFVINFNVIHVIAVCVLVWSLIDYVYGKMITRLSKNIFGWIMLVLLLGIFVSGYYYVGEPSSDTHIFGMFFFEHDANGLLSPADHLPLFPAMAWFVAGAFLGKVVYPSRTTLFPNAYSRVILPLTICGKISIWIYFASQVAMYGSLYLFVTILGVF